MFLSQLTIAIFPILNKDKDIILTLAYDLWDWHLEGIGKVTQDGEDDNTAKHAGQEVTDCQDDPVTENVKITRLGDHLRSGWPLITVKVIITRLPSGQNSLDQRQADGQP